MKNTLFIIPARGGSKGIPRKNIKLLNNKPLIYYSIDFARQFVSNEQICISTDDDEIINTVTAYNLPVPFTRPSELANDTAGSYEVLLHAINYYKNNGQEFETVILLQPTSPFRLKQHLIDAYSLYSKNIDMVVSVSESKSNPYYNIFEENQNGYLTKSKPSNYTRRQDCPPVYEYNGSIYIINTNSLFSKKINEFESVVKYVMPQLYSLDIDTPLDWKMAELIIDTL